jgi:hypothetical protein
MAIRRRRMLCISLLTFSGTMCRKWTSSFVAQFLVVSAGSLQPDLREYETYEEYESSPRRFRGFCRRCGTSLIWRSGDDDRTVDVFLGTLDERWLVHHADGKLGETLARPNGTQFWMENAIVGVTDLLKGGKEYPQEGPDGRFEKDEGHP